VKRAASCWTRWTDRKVQKPDMHAYVNKGLKELELEKERKKREQERKIEKGKGEEK